MSHIFISFSGKDAELARQVSQEIKERTGYQTWLYKERLAGGDNWIPEIDEAIQGCDALVIVLTRTANQSLYVTYEWALALGLGKPVVPVQFEDIPKEEHHDKLRSIQWENARSEHDWGRLILTLEQKIAVSRRYTVRVPREATQILREIAKLIDSPVRKQRMNALDQIAEMNDGSKISILLQALNSVAPDVRKKAAAKLGESQDRTVIPHLVQKLDDTDSSVRQEVIHALGELNDPAVTPHLLERLDDPDEGVRREALSSLTVLGGEAAIDALMARLSSADPATKAEYLDALGSFRDPRALPLILETLNDEYDDDFDTSRIRIAARSALVAYGATVIPVLKTACLSTENESIQEFTATVIAELTFPRTENRHFTRSELQENERLRQLGLEVLQELAEAKPAVFMMIDEWFQTPSNTYYREVKDILEKILFPDDNDKMQERE